MILNLGSLAFNANINGGGGTPAWGTELGQGDGYRFHFEEMNDFLTSMVYMSISDTDNIYCPLGKGGSRREDYDFVLASLYDKVFVNGQRISDAKFILLLVKQIQGDFHIGRRSLKYNPRITYKGIDYNKQCYDKIPSVLGITQNAAWFVDEIYTNNQDELHFVAYVLDALNEKVYASNELRKADFISKIQGERQNNRIIRKSLMDDSDETKSLQKIYYGAPGTGKSYIINDKTVGESVIRTTFHPDSDYSTFVGSYKPTMKPTIGCASQGIISVAELKKKLSDVKSKGGSYPCQRFAAQYWDSLINLQGSEIKDILDVCGFTETMATEISKGIAVGKDMTQHTEEKIAYEFIEQAFLKAYIKAWEFYAQTKEGNTEKQFLVIEEINRGNCAQIFGDLFQLLDRNEQGFSDYPISADSDMRKQLAKAFAGITFSVELKDAINSCYRDGHSKDYAQQVLDGKILLLPNNLYIWATMNTSDQSLFPIDSAFKRRWDWKYMPIKNAEKGWVIEVKDENGTKKYDWWEFIQKINAEIDDLTSSEDKKLGYFFCKAKGRVVSADVFVNKVMFYLWNDVVKDYDLSGRVAFQDNDGKVLTFGKFYENKVRAIEKLMENLGVNEINDENNNASTSDADASVGVFAVNGESFKVLGDVVYRAVELFVNNNPTMKDIDVANAWKQIKGTGTGFKYLVETAAEHDARKAISTDSRFDSRAKVLTTPMSEILYVSTEWTKDAVSSFMEQVNAQEWGIEIIKAE